MSVNVMANNLKVDVFNYFSLEVLEGLGIDMPEQLQIDHVSDILKRINDLTKDGSNGLPPLGLKR